MRFLSLAFAASFACACSFAVSGLGTDDGPSPEPDLTTGPMPDLAGADLTGVTQDLVMHNRDLVANLDFTGMPRDMTVAPDLTQVLGPSVTSVSPPRGPSSGGTTITITGSGFLVGATVTVHGAMATGVTFVDTSHLTAVTPAQPGVSGPVDVAVTNPGGMSAKLAGGFRYYFATFALAGANSLATGGTAVADIAIADMDGDGKNDIVVPVYSANKIAVLYNAGSSFSLTATGVSGNPEGIAVDDFDGNGLPDVAYSGYTNMSVNVLLNAGNRGFKPIASTTLTGSTKPVGVSAIVLRPGMKPDLLVANSGTSDMTLLTNNGSGVFSIAQATTMNLAGPWSIRGGDFNGDGRNDVAVANSAAVSTTELSSDSSGRLVLYALGGMPGGQFGIAVADFNGDGKNDIAATIWGTNQVGVALNLGAAGFGSPTLISVGTGPFGIATGDLNGDGFADLVVTNQTGNSATVLLGGGDGRSFSPSTVPVGAGPQAVAIGDLNGDGKLDFATANGQANMNSGVSVVLNTSQ